MNVSSFVDVQDKTPDCPQASLPDPSRPVSALTYLYSEVLCPSLRKLKLRIVANTMNMVLSIFIMKYVIAVQLYFIAYHHSTQIMTKASLGRKYVWNWYITTCSMDQWRNLIRRSRSGLAREYSLWHCIIPSVVWFLSISSMLKVKELNQGNHILIEVEGRMRRL
jgi:hypothetical protein